MLEEWSEVAMFFGRFSPDMPDPSSGAGACDYGNFNLANTRQNLRRVQACSSQSKPRANFHKQLNTNVERPLIQAGGNCGSSCGV
eukprot:3478893-Amphidinium_carterae.1